MKRETPTRSQFNWCSRRGRGGAIFDTKSHALHWDVRRRKSGPWQHTRSYNSWKAIKGWGLSLGQRPCQNPRVSFISCFCVQSVPQTKGMGSSGGNKTGGSKPSGDNILASRRTYVWLTHRCSAARGPSTEVFKTLTGSTGLFIKKDRRSPHRRSWYHHPHH